MERRVGRQATGMATPVSIMDQKKPRLARPKGLLEDPASKRKVARGEVRRDGPSWSVVGRPKNMGWERTLRIS